VEWVLDNAEAEASAIAHDILRRVLGSARRLPQCARLSGRPRRMERPPLDRLRRRRFADHAVLCRTHTQADRIAATLRAHGVPVDQSGELFDAPEVKDALAILAMIDAASSPGTLRALTIPDHALDSADLAALARLAHEAKQALPCAARDPSIATQLSRAGQEQLASLHALVDDLANCTDAWQALVQYLFRHSATMRDRITAAARGDFAARRALATLGQLITLAQNVVRQAPQECAPRHFIAYVRLLIEAGERISSIVPAEHADVVQLMTVHAAKGLEFPIVYVPSVQEGSFPPRKQYDSIPALPGLAHDAPGDDLQEERYLLYVAMSRARDQLVLSRAAARGEKPIKRSQLLPGSSEGTNAPWPLLRRVAKGPCSQPFAAPRLDLSPIIQTPIPATSLETYERCPRQYLYQYSFQLDDGLSPYLRMHQTIRDVVQDLAQRTEEGTLPDGEEALLAITWQAFVDHQMTEVLYHDDYFNEAFDHITHVWRDLGGDAYPDAVGQGYVVRRPAGEVSVWVDRVETGAAGTRWVRAHSGREREGDHLSTQVMLYALAYQQEHGAVGEIALHYTPTGMLRPATPRQDVLVAHTAQIDALLEGIRAGNWHAAPGPQCATCPFSLICPA
jgi:DNA helicase II / ATP-dependent DNA helicase PcrA